ncbi:hypothetical protein K491DRAFT_684620 [Lophiostoma macrostomum CBS 122681]|uniref:Uncharacterized protein n=1 Tax=Lophiostoma macrostomum CBS 122681 TaxID=1314788 RepID=A0A6A6SPL4_9PLEO|nr:hypothetical protein K491DRAFT_684620 [Lophiostoma macrostomum CBS 122681]
MDSAHHLVRLLARSGRVPGRVPHGALRRLLAWVSNSAWAGGCKEGSSVCAAAASPPAQARGRAGGQGRGQGWLHDDPDRRAKRPHVSSTQSQASGACCLAQARAVTQMPLRSRVGRNPRVTPLLLRCATPAAACIASGAADLLPTACSRGAFGPPSAAHCTWPLESSLGSDRRLFADPDSPRCSCCCEPSPAGGVTAGACRLPDAAVTCCSAHIHQPCHAQPPLEVSTRHRAPWGSPVQGCSQAVAT